MAKGKIICLVMAAGSGSRMQSSVKKQFLPLEGKAVIAHTMERLRQVKAIDGFLLVIAPEDEAQMRALEKEEGWQQVAYVHGGKERQDSVRAALQALPKETELVLIHDGARPFVPVDCVEAVIKKAKEMGAAVLAVPVKDTIKAEAEDHLVEKTVPRESLRAIQTPQVFQKDLICQSYEALPDTEVITDDAMAVERMGKPVALVMGSYQNIKLTTPEDMAFGAAILALEKQQKEAKQQMLPRQTAQQKETLPQAEPVKATAQVEIYTDGACSGNPGKGGYGVVLLFQGKRKELSAGYAVTTNNRMEVLAVIKALELLKKPCQVKLYSDSKYVVDAITKGWAEKWRKNNWMRTKTERASNVDLWEKLLDLLKLHKVQFIWVKGHAENVENERCDALARAAISNNLLLNDEGYIK